MVEAAQAPGIAADTPATAVPLWGWGLWKPQCQIRPVTQQTQVPVSTGFYKQIFKQQSPNSYLATCPEAK